MHGVLPLIHTQETKLCHTVVFTKSIKMHLVILSQHPKSHPAMYHF